MKTIFNFLKRSQYILISSLSVLPLFLVSCSTSSKQEKPHLRSKQQEAFKCHGKTITLTLKDVKSNYKKYPFRIGVPFPEGVLKSVNNICLWNADKTGRIPVDVKLVSSWKDGSVRWLQLLFQCDVFKDKTEQDKVVLEYGDNIKRLKPEEGISFRNTGNSLTVNSNKIQARFSKKGSALIDKLFYDLNRDGKLQKDEQVLGAKGVTHNLKVFFKKLSKIETAESIVNGLEIEECSKIQSTVKISGDYVFKDRLIASFIIRCYFYSGKGFLRFDHVFTYKADPENDFVADLNIRFNLKPELIHKTVFGENELKSVDAMVLQDWSNRYKVVDKDHNLLHQGKRFEGYSSVLSKPVNDLRMSFFLENFWQKYPKAIKVANDSVEIGLWPGDLKRLLDLRRYSDTIYTEAPDLETALTRMSRSAQGVAVYHKFFVELSNISSPVSKVDELAKILLKPPVPCFPSTWLRKTDIFGNFDHKIPDNWPRLWNKMKLFSRWHKANQEQFGWYGMLDFGDWRSRYYFDHWAIYGRHGWANNSADPIFGLMFAYLIGADVPSFRLAGETGEHYMNVDICHYADNSGRLFKNPPKLVGSGSRHGRQHWSGYLGYTGYTYPVGMCQYYLFTGEERYRDVLHTMGSFLADVGGTHGVFPDLQWISEVFMHEEKYQDFVKKVNAQIERSRNTICSRPDKIDAAHPEGWPSKMNFNFRVSTDDLPGLLLYVRRNKDQKMAALFPKMADMFLKNYKTPEALKLLSYNAGFHFLLPYAAYLTTRDRKYLDSYARQYSRYLPKKDFELKEDMSYDELRSIEMDESIGTTCRTYQDIWFLRSMPYIAAELSALGYNEKSYLDYCKNMKGAK
jgi:hypothetical protein